jgi:hypothetical protein
MDDLISLVEYAATLGLNESSVRRKVLRGNLPAAKKIGRNWVIPRNTPYTDARLKTNKPDKQE